MTKVKEILRRLQLGSLNVSPTTWLSAPKSARPRPLVITYQDVPVVPCRVRQASSAYTLSSLPAPPEL